MRVSQRGMSMLKILEMFKHFWPASEPCKQRTSRVMDPIFSMPALHTRTYPPCNSLSMGMQSLATLVCRIWVNYMWNMKIARQSVLFWRGSIKRLGFQTTNRYRAETFMNYSYRIGLPYFAGTSYEHMRVSQIRTSNLKILENFKHFWPVSEPCK